MNQPFDAGGGGFFIGLREQNDVPAETDVRAFQLHHDSEFGGEQRFVVLRTAAINKSFANFR